MARFWPSCGMILAQFCAISGLQAFQVLLLSAVRVRRAIHFERFDAVIFRRDPSSSVSLNSCVPPGRASAELRPGLHTCSHDPLGRRGIMTHIAGRPGPDQRQTSARPVPDQRQQLSEMKDLKGAVCNSNPIYFSSCWTSSCPSCVQ